MNRLYRFMVIILISLMVFLPAVFSCAIIKPAVESPVGGDIATFKDALKKAGFTVQEGNYRYHDVIALCSAGILDSCLGANVDSPYLAYQLPQAPGQQVTNMKVDPKSGLAFAYALRRDEAIVQVGYTPPEAGYFSYQSYLTLRHDSNQNSYMALFNSLGDSINNLTVNTSDANGIPFNQPVIIISTADQGIDKLVRTTAEIAGYSPNTFNTDVIPSSMVRMGLEEGADLFSFITRIASPSHKEELDNYIKNPNTVVLRLTPNFALTPDPFPVPTLRIRGTGKTELDMLPAVEKLRNAILARYGSLNATEVPTCIALPEGFTAIQSNVNTIGGTRDATYFCTADVAAWTKRDDSSRDAAFTLSDNPDDFIIIYGVNHEATGKATYANCVVYGLQYLNGVACIDSRAYDGSADDYIAGHPQSRYLYAWKIARRCYEDPRCLEVPAGPKRYGIELVDRLILLFRAYLEADTKVGPAPNELVMDRIIKFSPKTESKPQ